MAKTAKPESKPALKSAARMSKRGPLDQALLRKMDAYWRAANYLSVGQLYLLDNPLLRQPLKPEHLKRHTVGHWGTAPGQNFIYTHLNRVITRNDLNMIYLAGPGHGGEAVVAQTYLEGTYSEVYPNVGQDEEGMKRLFRQFAFPGGIPSHVGPEAPGSINEGGELGYSLSHAFGAVMDNPDLIAACVVGDGEAETGPLAAAWQSNKLINPITDGAVLPIFHLNGFKSAGPSIFGRITHEELEMYFKGCGWEPRFVEGDDAPQMHQTMAAALDGAGDQPYSGARPHPERPHPAPVAHDHLPLPQGLDLPRVPGRLSGGGHLPGPPHPLPRRRRTPGVHRPAGVLDAQLPPGGAL